MNFLDYIQSQTHNENLAVIEKEKNWTYKEFSSHALFVCNYLIENKIGKIMVCLPQGFYAYSILWGAYLAGVTFCPVTDSVPVERKKYYSSVFKPDLIIGNQAEAFLEGTFNSVSDFFKSSFNDSGVTSPKINKESLAYVIFTSGSTGLPKGVMVSRKALENFLNWSTKEYDVVPDDRWGQFSNLGFDLSVSDIFTAIIRGASLVAVSGIADKLLPGKIIKKKEITFWHSVPSVIDLLNKAGHLQEEVLSGVRIMTFCGERLFPAQLELLFKAKPDLIIYNTYGPTESTIFCSFLKLTADNYKQYCHNTVSIGTALPGCEIVLSKESENLGEIIIKGDCIAEGYLSPDYGSTSTSNSFRMIENKGKIEPAYFTGDYGEIVDENLYFVCRKDSQIKIMGNRIDLSEIDYHLREYGCKANITTYYHNKLISFMICEPYSEAAVKNYLAEKLPNYYLPNLMINKQSFPYNSNGKIDVNELLKEVVLLNSK